MDVGGGSQLEAETLAAIEAFVREQYTLQDVVSAGLALDPPAMIADVVVQDEFTYDVVLPWRGGLWLVYDST